MLGEHRKSVLFLGAAEEAAPRVENRISPSIVFPPEPPVAVPIGPERRGAGKGAPVFGAAKRTLAGEHRSGIYRLATGGVAGHDRHDSRWWAQSKKVRMGIPKGKETARFRSPWPACWRLRM